MPNSKKKHKITQESLLQNSDSIRFCGCLVESLPNGFHGFMISQLFVSKKFEMVSTRFVLRCVGFFVDLSKNHLFNQKWYNIKWYQTWNPQINRAVLPWALTAIAAGRWLRRSDTPRWPLWASARSASGAPRRLTRCQAWGSAAKVTKSRGYFWFQTEPKK